jgi:hypothetical protein
MIDGADTNMIGRCTKVLLTNGVTIVSLLLGADCALADKRAVPAPSAQTNFSVPIRATPNGASRPGAVLTIAETKTDIAAAGSSCEEQQGQLDAILAKGSDGTGPDELKEFSRTVTCDRLGPLVVAAIDRFNADSAARTGAAANSLDLVRATQVELARLGCFDGKISGSLTTTRDALARYMSSGGGTVASPDITEALVADLARHTDRVCPMSCGSGQIAQGDACIIDASRTDPAATILPDAGQKSAPERHAAPTDPSREPPAKAKAAAGLPHAPPAGHPGSPRSNSVYGLGF